MLKRLLEQVIKFAKKAGLTDPELRNMIMDACEKEGYSVTHISNKGGMTTVRFIGSLTLYL